MKNGSKKSNLLTLKANLGPTTQKVETENEPTLAMETGCESELQNTFQNLSTLKVKTEKEQLKLAMETDYESLSTVKLRSQKGS